MDEYLDFVETLASITTQEEKDAAISVYKEKLELQRSKLPSAEIVNEVAKYMLYSKLLKSLENKNV